MPYQFKYACEAEELEEECACPPEDAAEIGGKVTVYRFVFEECDDDSFVPQGVSRPSETANKPCAKRCEYLSLSFYEQRSSAEDAYAFLKKHFRGFVERAGTHLAKGYLQPGDGIALGPDQNTQIELFEAATANLLPRFSVLKEL